MRNCEAYEEWISAFLDGELSGTEQAELREHMAGCRRCQQYFDDLVAIHEALDQGDEVPVPEGFEDRIMARVRETAQEGRPAKMIRFPQWRRWAALAACCAVAAIGLWSFQGRKGMDQASMEASVTANTPYMLMDTDMPVEDSEDDGAVMTTMEEASPADMDERARMTNGGTGDDTYVTDAAAQKEAVEGETYDRDSAAPPEELPEPSPAAPAGSVADSSGQAAPSAPGGGEQITSEDAKSKALAHVGLTASQVTFTEVKLEWEDGLQVYEVEFYAPAEEYDAAERTEYDYEIDAVTGEIIKYDYDAESRSAPAPAPSSGTVITQDAAREIALDKVPGATAEHIVKLELDYDDGKAAYEVEIVCDNMEYEMKIDAADGRILKFEAEALHKR